MPAGRSRSRPRRGSTEGSGRAHKSLHGLLSLSLQVTELARGSRFHALGLAPGAPWLATLYGAYKARDEMIGRVYLQDRGVPSVGLRPGGVYGIGRDQGLTSK